MTGRQSEVGANFGPRRTEWEEAYLPLKGGTSALGLSNVGPPTPRRVSCKGQNTLGRGRLKKKMTAAPSCSNAFCSTLCNLTRRVSNPAEFKLNGSELRAWSAKLMPDPFGLKSPM